MKRNPLAGIRVLEAGERLAVSACGSVLAALGAQVSSIQDECAYRSRFPAAHADEKIFITASDQESLGQALQQADIVLASSDVSKLGSYRGPPTQIICDITAYGSSGPLAGLPHSDPLLQAVAGLADTTGEPDSAPTLCAFPETEGIGALYAAAGILTAIQYRTRRGSGQNIEIALFDCAFSTLSTFIPFHFIDKPVTRSGNRHVLAAPWNTYRARDAWLVICTGSDEQWLRLCQVIGRPDLAANPRLSKGPDRVQQRDLVDNALQRWIATLDAATAAVALQAQGVAAGPVVPVNELAREPNIGHRGLYSEHGLRSAIRYFPEASNHPLATPAVRQSHLSWGSKERSNLPLAGLKVIELGQYTTAPFVARHLGALGAQVLKIEPPGGDATRAWPPQQYGQGFFFSLSNSDKRSLCLDLRQQADRARFAELQAEADILVENLKPGTLDRFGFGPGQQAALNPRLVYCAISGFGADSAYPGRPAFDTVIQAMSGIMDSIRVADRPQKAGISLADVLGGLFALVGTLSALVERERTGIGTALDISMQDAAAWITQWTPPEPDRPSPTTVRCSDGYVVALTLNHSEHQAGSAPRFTRAEVVEQLRDRGVDSAAVLSTDEVARSAQARARELLVRVHDAANREWQVFNTPIRLGATPGKVRCAIGNLGEANNSYWR
jgi:crotonobetainyl-CoA:carnitine CoA-transferase CaiB-like acyl-CoA transferase